MKVYEKQCHSSSSVKGDAQVLDIANSTHYLFADIFVSPSMECAPIPASTTVSGGDCENGGRDQSVKSS